MPLNKENQQINIENWATVESPEGSVIRDIIKKSHSKCPSMGDHKPHVSACIHDPKSNQGYIISLCCDHCLERIQMSLKNNDKKFSIRKLNNIDVLYQNNVPKQIAVKCNSINMEALMKLVGTKPI